MVVATFIARHQFIAAKYCSAASRDASSPRRRCIWPSPY